MAKTIDGVTSQAFCSYVCTRCLRTWRALAASMDISYNGLRACPTMPCCYCNLNSDLTPTT